MAKRFAQKSQTNVPQTGVSALEMAATQGPRLRRIVAVGLGVVAAFLLAAGAVNVAVAQTSASGQTHVVDNRQVFCETTMDNNALKVECVSGDIVHLVIVQQDGKLVAYPQTKFGVRINAAAYGYQLAQGVTQ